MLCAYHQGLNIQVADIQHSVPGGFSPMSHPHFSASSLLLGARSCTSVNLTHSLLSSIRTYASWLRLDFPRRYEFTTWQLEHASTVGIQAISSRTVPSKLSDKFCPYQNDTLSLTSKTTYLLCVSALVDSGFSSYINSI